MIEKIKAEIQKLEQEAAVVLNRAHFVDGMKQALLLLLQHAENTEVKVEAVTTAEITKLEAK